MGVAYVILAILLSTIGILIFAAIIRFAIDSSKTSKRLEDLIIEVQLLRKEMKIQSEKKHIIDKRV